MGEQTLQIPHYVDVDPETLRDAFTDEEIAFRDFKNASTADSMGILRVGRVRKSTITGSPATAKSIHCFACPIDRYEYDELLEVIRETYGGGLYRLTGVQPGHKGSKFNRLIEIEEPLKVTDNEGKQKSGVDNVGVLLESLSNILEKSQERTESLLARVNPAMQNTDPFASLEKVVRVLSGLGVLGPHQNQGGDGLAEIERFIKLKSLIGEMGGSDERGGDPGFYGMLTETIRQFGGPLLMAVQAGTQNGQISRSPSMQPPTRQREVIEQETGQQKPSAEQMQQLQEMKKQVDILVMNARANVNAEDFAAVVYNMTPDDKLEELHNFMRAENCIESLTKLNGEVQNLLPWFQTLRNSLLAMLDESVIDETGLQDDDDGAIVPASGAVTGKDGMQAAPDATIQPAPKTTPNAARAADDAASDT